MGKESRAQSGSLLEANPGLASQWHPSLNLPLTPADYAPNSNRKVWWVCKSNPKHVWQATIQSRNSGKGCGLCRGLVVLTGLNDLTTLFPAVSLEWDLKRNAPISPDKVSPTSSKKIWWICPLGHSYLSSIESRVKGLTCKVCSNLVILPGFNDLATKFPEIAVEFAADLNGGLTASQVGGGSGSSYWWRCRDGHTWKARVTNRTALGSGCPSCSGKRIIQGVNDFGSIHKNLLVEWSEKNQGLDPSSLGRSAKVIVWWDCEKGHSWKASISDRTAGQGCAVCANRQVIVGVNDFGTTHPHLVEQIDDNSTSREMALSIPAGSAKKLWWICGHGHRWQAAVSSRALDGTNCPYCSGNFVIPGTNDLATLNPDLAQEWHALKNNLDPSQVKPGSSKRVWWMCRRGHEWKAAIAARNAGTGCPYCSNVKVLEGFNDLATVFPEIAATWDHERNLKTPSEIMPGTHEKYWWNCANAHSWQASPNTRIQGRNCPTCAPSGFVPGKPGIFYFLEHREWLAFKVGITNTHGSRLKSLYKDGWKPIHLLEFALGSNAEALEQECLRWIRTELHLPPYLSRESMARTGGWTETFSSELASASTIVDFITSTVESLGLVPSHTEI